MEASKSSILYVSFGFLVLLSVVQLSASANQPGLYIWRVFLDHHFFAAIDTHYGVIDLGTCLHTCLNITAYSCSFFEIGNANPCNTGSKTVDMYPGLLISWPSFYHTYELQAQIPATADMAFFKVTSQTNSTAETVFREQESRAMDVSSPQHWSGTLLGQLVSRGAKECAILCLNHAGCNLIASPLRRGNGGANCYIASIDYRIL